MRNRKKRHREKVAELDDVNVDHVRVEVKLDEPLNIVIVCVVC